MNEIDWHYRIPPATVSDNKDMRQAMANSIFNVRE